MEEIAAEVAEFYADLREAKHGFIAVSEGLPFVMTQPAARRFLSAVNAQQLSPNASVYIADCIVASEDIEFADQATRDAVSFIEDDSNRFIEGSDGLWTPEEVAKVLASLD